MKKLSSFWMTGILIGIAICSWPLLHFFTWGSNDFVNAIPLFILILQIIINIRFKNKKLFWLLLFNAVVFLGLYNTIKASFNYLRGRPTIIKTCCCAGWEADPEDEKRLIYVDYFDDDCGDWTGLYPYTLDINNGVTEGLIDLLGNPIKSIDQKTLKKNTSN